MHSILTLALVWAPAPAPAPDWHYLDAPPGALGTRWTQVDPTSAAQPVPGLEGVRLLPCEAAGVCEALRLLPDCPREFAVAGGVSRLTLPAGQGQLYRFERVEADASVFGWFRVPPVGPAEVVLQATGWGPDLRADPWLPRIAVAPDGAGLLAATRLEAGGDVWSVDLAAGTSESLSAALAPLDVSTDGLALAGDWGVVLERDGVWRFPRVGSATLEAVALSGSDGWVHGRSALSPSGLRAAVVAGPTANQARVWTFGLTGPAQAAEMPAMEFDANATETERLLGPFVAVDDSGLSVACRPRVPKPDGGSTREVLRASVGITAPTASPTADAVMIDTLDEVGFLRFTPAGLVFLVGERDPVEPGSLDKAELYLSANADGAPLNLSQTSGDLTAPFGAPGSLTNEDGMALDASGQTLLAFAKAPQTLLAIDLNGNGIDVLTTGVKSVEQTYAVGGDTYFVVRSDVPADRVRVWRRPASGVPQLLADLPEGSEIPQLLGEPGGSIGGRLQRATSQWLFRYQPGGASEMLTAIPFTYGPEVVWAPGGQLRFSGALSPQAGLAVGWSGGGVFELGPALPPDGFLLP